MSRGRGCRTLKLRIDCVSYDAGTGQIRGISGSIEGDRGARENVFITIATPGHLFAHAGRAAIEGVKP